MSSTTDSTENSTITDNSVPTDEAGQPLIWDGNDARNIGLLNETSTFLELNGLHQACIQQRAKLLSNGKLAVESISVVPFILGTITEAPRSLLTLAPPPAERIIEVNAARAAAQLSPYVPITAMPTGASDTVIVQPLHVKSDCGKLMATLHHVFGHAEPSAALFRAAKGCPYALVSSLIARCNASTMADRSVVSAEFDAIRAGGIPGQLRLDKLTDFNLRYQRAKASLAPSARPSAASEVQMIDLFAFRDADLRHEYRMQSIATPPADMTAAIKIIRDILTSRLRAEQLDAATAGEQPTSFIAADAGGTKPGPTQPPPTGAATDAAKLEALAALAASLGIKDPTKLLSALKKTKGKGKGPKDKGKGEEKKVKVPRDSDGKILRWVEGMGPCKCGGNHLYRDCPDNNKEEKAAKADLLGSLNNMSLEELRAQMADFLGSDTASEVSSSSGASLHAKAAASCDECEPEYELDEAITMM